MKNGKILLPILFLSKKESVSIIISRSFYFYSASISIYVAVNRKIDDETPRSFGTSPQLSSDLILF